MLKSIANNPLIDDIWEKWQAVLEPLRTELNRLMADKMKSGKFPRKALDLWSENEAKIWAVAYSDSSPFKAARGAQALSTAFLVAPSHSTICPQNLKTPGRERAPLRMRDGGRRA